MRRPEDKPLLVAQRCNLVDVHAGGLGVADVGA
jgi:hypothetical protein